MALKFFMTPGSCSTGIHILLESCEQIFEVHIVDLLAGDNLKADYLAINPRGTIPTLLLENGQSLSDFQSIAWWLAKSFPQYQLLPDSLIAQAKVLEYMNYVIQTIHGEGFTRIFTTENYLCGSMNESCVKTQGNQIVEKGFSILDQLIADEVYLLEKFSIADAALFYVEFWAIRLEMKLPENCFRHYENMLQKREVRQVMAEEGYHSIL